MANPKIGLQLSTVAPVIREIGLYETLKQVAEIGIHHVEVSQVTMNEENIALLLKAKENFGIQVSAMTAMLAPMGNQYDAWFEIWSRISTRSWLTARLLVPPQSGSEPLLPQPAAGTRPQSPLQKRPMRWAEN